MGYFDPTPAIERAPNLFDANVDMETDQSPSLYPQ